jgi:23S rRNA (guanosine2251-2'-O)-methyltransferase
MLKESMIYGIYPVLEALQTGQNIHKILILKTIQGNNIQQIIELSKNNDIPFQFVPKEKLNQFTQNNHQGIIALLSAVEYYDIENLVPKLFEEVGNPIIGILDGITDVRNIGAIARSAECFGISALYTPATGSGMITEDAIKSSAGALLRIPLARSVQFLKGIDYLVACGFQFVAMTEKGEDYFSDIALYRPTCLILGSENEGIPTKILQKSDVKIRLNMTGNIASLNVSVAAGIIFYLFQEHRS